MIDFTFRSYKKEAIAAKDEAVERALVTVGLVMEKYAKEELSKPKMHKTARKDQDLVRPNRDSGRLINSVVFATNEQHSTGSSPAQPSDYAPHMTPEKGEVYVGTNVEYAPHIEYGTSRGINPYPFLRPAAADHIPEFKQAIETELKK